MTEQYYLFYRNKISSIIDRMSDNVKHWFISFLTVFSVLIAFCSLVLGIASNVSANAKIVLKVISSVLCLLPLISFVNIWKYLKIEKCYKELEREIPKKNNKGFYDIQENYDWKSVLKNSETKNKIRKSMFSSFVVIISIIFVLIEIGLSITFIIIF